MTFASRLPQDIPRLTDLPPESASPGPWRPYLGLRIKVAARRKLAEEVAAWTAFRQGIERRLNTGSYEFRFEDDGHLLIRQAVADPDATRIGVTAVDVHEQICEAFLELRLGELPPAFNAYVPTEISPSIDESQERVRGRIGRLLHWLQQIGSHSQPKRRTDSRSKDWFAPEYQAHERAQLQDLAEWIDRIDAANRLLPAIVAWHLDLQQKLNSSQVSELVVTPGNVVCFSCNDGYGRIAMRGDGDQFTLTFQRNDEAASLRLEVIMPGSSFGAPVQATADGLHCEFLPGRLSVRHQSSAIGFLVSSRPQ